MQNAHLALKQAGLVARVAVTFASDWAHRIRREAMPFQQPACQSASVACPLAPCLLFGANARQELVSLSSPSNLETK